MSASLAVPVTVRDRYFGLSVTGESPRTRATPARWTCHCPEPAGVIPSCPGFYRPMGGIWGDFRASPHPHSVRPSGFEPETCGLRVVARTFNECHRLRRIRLDEVKQFRC